MPLKALVITLSTAVTTLGISGDTSIVDTVSNLVNQGTSTAGGTRKPVQLVVYKRGSKARERKEKNSSAA